MGICADLIILKKVNEHYTGENLPYNIETYPDFIREQIKKDFDGGKYFKATTICYIGSSYAFTKEVLRNYENTIGLLKLKDNLDLLTEETKNKLFLILENYFKIELKYILERNDLYIELNF